MKRAVAVPTCSSTTKARNEGSRWSMDQWSRRGRMTVCPRLLTGKSSVTPCSRASTRAWKNDTSQYHACYATRVSLPLTGRAGRGSRPFSGFPDRLLAPVAESATLHGTAEEVAEQLQKHDAARLRHAAGMNPGGPVLVLAGGVGAARFLRGLVQVV